MSLPYNRGDRIWIPHEEDAWLSGTVKTCTNTIVEVITEARGVQKIQYRNLPPFELCGSHIDDDIDNLVDLDELSEGAILHHIRKRYFEKLIYTFVGPILVAVNPFENLPIYTDKDIRKAVYHTNAYPHIFVTAAIAYSQMCADGSSQSVLISGESGAGKTETTKKVLSYITSVAADKSGAKSNPNAAEKAGIEERILQSNPLLEALGNSKTLRNNNSSRFGKYMKVGFNHLNRIQGCEIENYLLEKSRVVMQLQQERSYHIFYQLICGADNTLRSTLKLKPIQEYKYLGQSGCISIPGVNDSREFAEVMEAVYKLDFDNTTITDMFRIVTAVLTLGNVTFEAAGSAENESAVESSAQKDLQDVCEQLGLDAAALSQGLTEKQMMVGRETVTAKFNKKQAFDNRDTLAKSLYSLLFDWVIRAVNKSLKGEGDINERVAAIGILDIFGFEVFKYNSFEQLCINYANEKLQLHFNSVVFAGEMNMYAEEGIPLDSVDFTDNLPCVNLIENRSLGLISLLEEECSLGNGKDVSYVNKIEKNFGEGRKDHNPCYAKNKLSSNSFKILHFAGEVEYTVEGWLDKNRDTMSASLKETIENSSNALVRALYDAPVDTADTGKRRKNQKSTLGGQFRNQLVGLVDFLQTTEPHFVRCIKPNASKKASEMEGVLALNQMKYSGLFEAIRIRKAGYSYRASLKQFANQYKLLADDLPILMKSGQISDKDACERILSSCIAEGILKRGVAHTGVSKVFLKSNADRANLESYKKVRVEKFAVKIQRAYRGHLAYKAANAERYRLMEAMRVAARDVLRRNNAVILIQKYMRGMLCRMNLKQMSIVLELRRALDARDVELALELIEEVSETGSDEGLTRGKNGDMLVRELARAQKVVKFIQLQDTFLSELEKYTLEEDIDNVVSLLSKAEDLELRTNAVVLQAEDMVNAAKKKRVVLKKILKFLHNHDNIGFDPEILVNEAIRLNIEATIIEKVRKANDNSGPRLRSLLNMRRAIETVHESSIIASLKEIEALRKYHPTFAVKECKAANQMLSMLAMESQLYKKSSPRAESPNRRASVSGMADGPEFLITDYPRLTPTVMALCDEICYTPDLEVASNAMRRLQLMTKSKDEFEELIRCFKWSKLFCTWNYNKRSAYNVDMPSEESKDEEDAATSTKKRAMSMRRKSTRRQSMKMPTAPPTEEDEDDDEDDYLILGVEKRGRRNSLQDIANTSKKISAEDLEEFEFFGLRMDEAREGIYLRSSLGGDVGTAKSSAAVLDEIMKSKEEEANAVDPAISGNAINSSIQEEIDALDKIFDKKKGNKKSTTASNTSKDDNKFLKNIDVVTKAMTEALKGEKAKRDEQAAISAKLRNMTPKQRMALQKKVYDADKCRTLIPPSATRVHAPAGVKGKPKTEFVALEESLEAKLVKSRRDANRQRKKHAEMFKKLQSTPGKKGSMVGAAWK
jgi:myosin heavy subunit